jgi:hypothetical protein
MNRAYGSFLIGFDCSNGFLIRCYKMCRADGSMKRNNSLGMYHIVATDFNPLVNKLEEMLSSIGTT